MKEKKDYLIMQLQRDFLSNKFGLEKGIPNHVIAKRLLEQQAQTF